jgi:glycosyltransferase involved in cell wall biosynthesis
LKRKIVVSVISDLVSDQRVHKVCNFLNDSNWDVTLIGRKHKQSLAVENRSYKTERIHCVFSKGVLLYAEFMLKLFFRLLSKKPDVFLANDLDTLLPNFLISRLKTKKLVYDSHEYFTGVPELEKSPFKKNIWKSMERLILPKIKFAYTVNQSIADLYHSQYGINMKVVRNVPILENKIEKTEMLYPENKTILLLQGAGINEERGAEELVESMSLLPDNYKLYFIGSGTVWNKLKKMADGLSLNERIEFIEKISFSKLREYTRQAHLGLSLDKSSCLNYKLSLPNKVFDYIHAGIPILSSSVVEVKNIIDGFEVGTTIKDITPSSIAEAIENIFGNMALYNRWKENTYKTAENLCWQKEEKVLEEIFSSL